MVSLSLARRSTPIATRAALDPALRAQVQWVLSREDIGSIEAARKSGEWSALEVVDVLADGALAYRLILYPFGNGVLFEGASTRALCDIAQHHAEVRPGVAPELAEALVAALGRDGARIGVVERFEYVRPSRKRAPSDAALLTAIEQKLAAGKRLSDEQVDALYDALVRVVGKRGQPLTARELSPLGRRLVVAMAKGGAYHHKKLGALGLPTDAGGLLVLMGEREATGLRQALVVNGVSRSVLEHARQVAKGALDGKACIDAIVALGAPAALDVLRRLLRFDPEERMTSFPWGETEVAAARWLAQLVARLGAPARALAAELAEEDPGSGRFVRLFVWATTAQKIAVTPPRIAKQLRGLWGSSSSPQIRADAAPLLAEILAPLPDGAALVKGVATHIWYPPGKPVKGVHQGAGFAEVDPAALAAAQGTRAPALLDDVARLLARATLLGKPFASVAAEARAVLRDAGVAGREAMDRVAAESSSANAAKPPVAARPAKGAAAEPAKRVRKAAPSSKPAAKKSSARASKSAGKPTKKP